MGGDAQMYVWPSQIFSALLLGTHHLNTSLVWGPCFSNALHKEPAKNCEFLVSLYKGPSSVKVIDSPVVCQSLHEGCHQWSAFPTQLNCLFPSSSCSVQTGQWVANKGYSKQSLVNTPPTQNFKLLTSQNHIRNTGEREADLGSPFCQRCTDHQGLYHEIQSLKSSPPASSPLQFSKCIWRFISCYDLLAWDSQISSLLDLFLWNWLSAKSRSVVSFNSQNFSAHAGGSTAFVPKPGVLSTWFNL